jgi:hypothetical protein
MRAEERKTAENGKKKKQQKVKAGNLVTKGAGPR